MLRNCPYFEKNYYWNSENISLLFHALDDLAKVAKETGTCEDSLISEAVALFNINSPINNMEIEQSISKEPCG
jgi:hypothetical protein